MNIASNQTTLGHSLILDENQWVEQKSRHVQLLSSIVTAHQDRSSRAEKHPIIDFLFEYYHFKPAKLLEWSPGFGVVLEGHGAQQFLTKKHFSQSNAGIYLDLASFPHKRTIGLDWIIRLLSLVQSRKPAYGCFGLHEWCMVYEEPDIRHPYLSLRLTQNQIRSVVEQQQGQCTHYDAFRFFSKSARKFNRLTLVRSDMMSKEQPGCLHSNMDLYRWSYKFYPWLASELVARTFLLALKIRETDMRASPYDVSGYTTLPAIKIETRHGKEEYVALQKDYYQKACKLRAEVIERLRKLRTVLGSIKST